MPVRVHIFAKWFLKCRGSQNAPFLKKYSGLSVETTVTLFEVRMCNRFAVFNAQPNCLIDRFAEHTQTDENNLRQDNGRPLGLLVDEFLE